MSVNHDNLSAASRFIWGCVVGVIGFLHVLGWVLVALASPSILGVLLLTLTSVSMIVFVGGVVITYLDAYSSRFDSYKTDKELARLRDLDRLGAWLTRKKNNQPKE